jgi:hypothetical protein
MQKVIQAESGVEVSIHWYKNNAMVSLQIDRRSGDGTFAVSNYLDVFQIDTMIDALQQARDDAFRMAYEYGSAPAGTNQPITTAGAADAWSEKHWERGNFHLVRREVGKWKPARGANSD